VPEDQTLPGTGDLAVPGETAPEFKHQKPLVFDGK